MEYVYVLLADGDGTLHSINEPWGVAVKTEEEAKRYVKKGGVGYTHGYFKCRVFDSFEDGIDYVYHPEKGKG